MPKWIWFLIFSLLLGLIGQLLLKAGATQLKSHVFAHISINLWLEHLFTNPFLLTGLLSYGLSSVFWIMVLKEQALSLVYPLIASNYILVVLLAKFIHQETISPLRWLGTAIIALGIVVISRS